MVSLFSKTRDLVVQIDNYIDLVVQSSLHFKESVKLFLNGKYDEFEEKMSVVRRVENDADNTRKNIEAQLYRQTLIPESRGDVLGVLESMDSIIDRAKLSMLEFSIEKPQVPKKIADSLIDLSEHVVSSVDALTLSVRAFFHDINAVKDHLHKVKFYEKEADILSERTKREIFNLKINLSNKIQLKSIVDNIDILADLAEVVSERIAIATIKRVI